MKRVLYAFILITLVVSIAFADEPHRLERIVVTPSRIEQDERRTGRSVRSIGPDELADSIYRAIPDFIGNVGGVDIRRRGPEGVQADVNIRGTTFEQNTVMIDGVKVNDPQTGHYSMDLAVSAGDIDRIEILKGPASSLYGANSFGGVINIITKKPEGKAADLFAEGGSFDYFRTSASVTYPFAAINNRFTIEESRSTGYMPETEFNILSLSDAANVKTPVGEYDFLFGYTKKDFGADSFYSNIYPNEEEHTDTRFFKIDGRIEEGDLAILPKLFLRRHWDKFALDRNRPGWQTNYHTTYTYGGEIGFALKNDFMDVAGGYELAQDTIDSTNIQTHSRTRDGLYVEASPRIIDRLSLDIGFREDYFTGFGWQASPSVSASYELFKEFSMRGSAGRAYRIPTFTDLYYNDVANVGNDGLKPEYSWSYEAGADYRTDIFTSSVTYFYRDTSDTIDWTKTVTKNPWQATNIGLTQTNGVEFSVSVLPSKMGKGIPVDKIFFDYTALDTYNKHSYLSKYALDYLKQQISSGLEWQLFGFRNLWVLNYKKRIGDSGYVVVDTRVSKEIVRKDRLAFEAFLEVTNIFNVEYSEQSDISMPPAAIRSGARLRF